MVMKCVWFPLSTVKLYIKSRYIYVHLYYFKAWTSNIISVLFFTKKVTQSVLVIQQTTAPFLSPKPYLPPNTRPLQLRLLLPIQRLNSPCQPHNYTSLFSTLANCSSKFKRGFSDVQGRQIDRQIDKYLIQDIKCICLFVCLFFFSP